MEAGYYRTLEPFWGSWHISRLIGEGAYGKVFEIEKEDFGRKYHSAMKAVTIPQSESEWKSALADGMDERSTTSFFKGYVQELANEIELMSQLKGHSNIVSYEDHAIVEHADGHGWDILIRMELLKPFIDILPSDASMDRSKVIKLGIDICTALELCQKDNMIHRDIKPENIFISNNGDFKLGDFGIARKVEQTSGALSKKGTFSYMAPEVYQGKNYDATVDLYSLGMVMYQLLNKKRLPFLPPYPEPLKYRDKEDSLKRRMNGEELQLPVDAQDELGRIILKACSYKRENRFDSASQMKKALVMLSMGTKTGIVEEDLHSKPENAEQIPPPAPLFFEVQKKEVKTENLNNDFVPPPPVIIQVGNDESEYDHDGGTIGVYTSIPLKEDNAPVKKKENSEPEWKKADVSSLNGIEINEKQKKKTLIHRIIGIVLGFAGIACIVIANVFSSKYRGPNQLIMACAFSLLIVGLVWILYSIREKKIYRYCNWKEKIDGTIIEKAICSDVKFAVKAYETFPGKKSYKYICKLNPEAETFIKH